jgi:hypothetical protein
LKLRRRAVQDQARNREDAVQAGVDVGGTFTDLVLADTAEGGGAEYASDEKVVAAMREGRRVNLDARDTPDRRHRAAAWNLDIHSFYRQAMLLVRWLRDQDEAKFRELVLALQHDADFIIAFADVYGSSPAIHFTAFYDAVLGDNGAVQAAPSTP